MIWIFIKNWIIRMRRGIESAVRQSTVRSQGCELGKGSLK